MYPLKLSAPLKDYIWGGRKLVDQFDKKTDLDKVAESWELSCHKAGSSVITNGIYANMTLSDYVNKNGKSVLGKNSEHLEDFPILIKLIDANDNLSVQVHPDDEYAQRVEGEYGKTEMWYIIDCEPDSELIHGFKQDITKDELQTRIKNNTLLEVCNSVPVKKGDVFFIEAGTVHAIGKGILIAEVQQNSNVTYRVYDYGRKDAQGNERELHIEKAIEVMNLKAVEEDKSNKNLSTHKGYTERELTRNKYFSSYEISVESSFTASDTNKSFNSILVVSGEANLIWDNNTLEIKKGDSIFIPADMGNYEIKGECLFIFTHIES